ncbi:MAG: OadG family protein [Acutalibacteraceae bacterium]
MFLINTLMEDISVGTAGLVALLGYAVVFIGLIALMVVVMIMGKVIVREEDCACRRSRCRNCRSGSCAQGCPRTCHRHRRRMQAL